jgi:predicted O-methyltransferase YrrM
MTKTAYDLSDWLGYLKHDEIDLLRAAADLLPPYPTVVNLGAGAGTTSLAVAEARPDASITTVDMNVRGPLGSLEGERNAFKDTGQRTPTQILGDSAATGRNWHTPIDMVIIDADHTEKGIAADIAAWYPHVKEGGYLVFHDYAEERWPDVKIVVDRELSKLLFVGCAGHLLVLCKQVNWHEHD